ncbi:MAG: glycosyltransferase [Betaproteobacteria bacterium]|nr:glycosyltransferase [Betaproteobacteria bacterium]
MWTLLVFPGLLIWLGIMLVPWRPWRTGESFEWDADVSASDLSDVTALIPARNEAAHIEPTLKALTAQGNGLRVVLVDDQSTDGTREIASRLPRSKLEIIAGTSPPAGWTGKLWALEQGRVRVTTPLTLLLDADIELGRGALAALREKMRREELRFISIMARLPMEGFWEKLLLPAFVYFFRLLYPFRLSNDPRASRVAAAAGGCILLETRVLSEIGGFGALRGAIIDDCALARLVKDAGHATWIGLARAIRSTRRYPALATIWNMVARSAFSQLEYSSLLLLLATAVLLIAFAVPVAGLAAPEPAAQAIALATLGLMGLSYSPTLRYYGLSAGWALAMPVIGVLFAAMTWHSAFRHWLGYGVEWRERRYLGSTSSNG